MIKFTSGGEDAGYLFTSPEVLQRIDWEKYDRQNRISDELISKRKSPEKWNLIKRLYAENMGDIMEAGGKRKRRGMCPYFTDWSSFFTPIEMDAWCAIRGHGIPMYPQFPVLGYFIDFANPCVKVGIELDGAQWHDEDKDRARDAKLSAAGWTIIRIPGRECYRQYKNGEDLIGMDREEKEREIENWIMNTCDGVIAAIREVYFSEKTSERFDLAVASIEAHRLVDVPPIPSPFDVYVRA